MARSELKRTAPARASNAVGDRPDDKSRGLRIVVENGKPVPAKDPSSGRFLTGNNGGGRPKGSRSKLGEDFLSAIQSDFAMHGPATIAKVRKEYPHVYLKVVASLLPKDVNVKASPLEDLSDDELEASIQVLLKMAQGDTNDPDGGG